MILTLGERIKSRRLELELTQTQLGEMVGLTQSALQNIEVGKTNRPRNIDIIAAALNCSSQFLQFGINLTDESNVSYAPTFKNNLPMISWVQAGNWSEIEILPYDDIEYYLCPINCSKKSFVLKVQGSSMEPRFIQGEHIYVDPEAEVENGSLVIARLVDENQATFKQLIIEGDKKFLKALNPNWPTQIIEINGNCTIVGKVIYKGGWC